MSSGAHAEGIDVHPYSTCAWRPSAQDTAVSSAHRCYLVTPSLVRLHQWPAAHCTRRRTLSCIQQTATCTVVTHAVAQMKTELGYHPSVYSVANLVRQVRAHYLSCRVCAAVKLIFVTVRETYTFRLCTEFDVSQARWMVVNRV